MTTQPSAEELLKAVVEVRERNPDFGVKRVWNTIKESKNWDVSEKRVKKVLQGLSAEGGGSGDPTSADASGATKVHSSGQWVPSERPSPRGYFTTSVLDAGTSTCAQSHMILFGGEYYDNKKNLFFNDVFELEVPSCSWRRADMAGSNKPPARSAHQACVWGEYLYIFGGESSAANGDNFKLHDDLWRLHIRTATWERVSAPNGPSGRSGHRMVVMADKLIVYGGMGANRYFQDLHMFDLKESKWMTKAVELGLAKAKNQATPGPRSGFVMFPDGDQRVYIWGGTREKGRGTESLCDMWRLDLQAYVWERLALAGQTPPARSGMCVCVGGQHAFLFGGVSEEGEGKDSVTSLHSDLFIFYLRTCTWAKFAAGRGGICGRRNATCSLMGPTHLCVIGGLIEEGAGKREKELTMDDVWVSQIAGEADAMSVHTWQCLVPASGAGAVWNEGSDSGGDDDD